MNTLAKDVYIASILNPNMRVFDVEMCTEYGTSYNSYVVLGSKKAAIIEANHATFTEEWFCKVEAALQGRQPDYLVINHTEPDHSGAVSACLRRYPNITVVCSSGAAVNLKHITNMPSLAPRVVKDGESIDLGGMTLQFVIAPFLHWPDTMFTWIPERKIAFTCDFLGAHFCEPRFFDHRIIYRRDFTAAFKDYYDAIMAPFGSWVQKGLDKLEALDADIVATSHGPILTKSGDLPVCIEHYRQWSSASSASSASSTRSASSAGSAKSEEAPQKVSLFYCSAYGNTQKLAEHIAEGIRSVLPSAQVTAHNLVGANSAHMCAELNGSDAILIGSPTINRDALPTVWSLLAHIDAINIVKRPVALFGSFGWSGEALPHLAERFTALKAKVYEAQFKVQFVPSEDNLKAAEEFGREFAESLG